MGSKIEEAATTGWLDPSTDVDNALEHQIFAALQARAAERYKDGYPVVVNEGELGITFFMRQVGYGNGKDVKLEGWKECPGGQLLFKCSSMHKREISLYVYSIRADVIKYKEDVANKVKNRVEPVKFCWLRSLSPQQITKRKKVPSSPESKSTKKKKSAVESSTASSRSSSKHKKKRQKQDTTADLQTAVPVPESPDVALQQTLPTLQSTNAMLYLDGHALGHYGNTVPNIPDLIGTNSFPPISDSAVHDHAPVAQFPYSIGPTDSQLQPISYDHSQLAFHHSSSSLVSDTTPSHATGCTLSTPSTVHSEGWGPPIQLQCYPQHALAPSVIGDQPAYHEGFHVGPGGTTDQLPYLCDYSPTGSTTSDLDSSPSPSSMSPYHETDEAYFVSMLSLPDYFNDPTINSCDDNPNNMVSTYLG